MKKVPAVEKCCFKSCRAKEAGSIQKCIMPVLLATDCVHTTIVATPRPRLLLHNQLTVSQSYRPFPISHWPIITILPEEAGHFYMSPDLCYAAASIALPPPPEPPPTDLESGKWITMLSNSLIFGSTVSIKFGLIFQSTTKQGFVSKTSSVRFYMGSSVSINFMTGPITRNEILKTVTHWEASGHTRWKLCRV